MSGGGRGRGRGRGHCTAAESAASEHAGTGWHDKEQSHSYLRYSHASLKKDNVMHWVYALSFRMSSKRFAEDTDGNGAESMLGWLGWDVPPLVGMFTLPYWWWWWECSHFPIEPNKCE